MSVLIVRTKEKPPYAYQLKYDGKTIYVRLLDSETYRTKLELEVYRSKEDKKIYLIERKFLDRTSVKERKYLYKGERIPSVGDADPFELFNLISGKKGAIRWCAGWQKQNEVLDNSNHNYYNYNTTKRRCNHGYQIHI